MANLYEISQDLIGIEEIIENTEGEEREQAEEIKEIIKKELENKAENIAYYIRNTESNIEQKKAEEKRIKESRQADERRLKNFKNYVIEVFTELDKKKIETSIGKLSVRTSKAVEVSADVNTLPEQYKRVKTTVEANKTELKKALQSGEHIDGVELVENYSLGIR